MKKLFVWQNAFHDYTAGLAVALAENAEEARDLIRPLVGYDASDLGKRPEEFDLDKSVAFFVHGGG
jgi:hypothetical protein